MDSNTSAMGGAVIGDRRHFRIYVGKGSIGYPRITSLSSMVPRTECTPDGDLHLLQFNVRRLGLWIGGNLWMSE